MLGVSAEVPGGRLLRVPLGRPAVAGAADRAGAYRPTGGDMWQAHREGLQHYAEVQRDKLQWRRSLIYGAVTFILGFLAAWLGEWGQNSRGHRPACQERTV